jgi:hypothetical protein
MCGHGLTAQCETTQNRATGKGASLFGYTSLYGSLPGGQAEYLRVPQAQFGPIPVPSDGPDERFRFLSDIIPTAWQSVKWADVGAGSMVAVLGLGRSGSSAPGSPSASTPGASSGSPPCPSASPWLSGTGSKPSTTPESTTSRRRSSRWSTAADPTRSSTRSAWRLTAHGSPLGKLGHAVVAALPDAIAAPLADKMAVDRLGALHTAIKVVLKP